MKRKKVLDGRTTIAKAHETRSGDLLWHERHCYDVEAVYEQGDIVSLVTGYETFRFHRDAFVTLQRCVEVEWVSS